jgi:hypothetical protein
MGEPPKERKADGGGARHDELIVNIVSLAKLQPHFLSFQFKKSVFPIFCENSNQSKEAHRSFDS